jgi:5-formyltetrahydrofolate cyclo-ligase
MRAVLCGLAFDEQVVDELPVEPNDRPVTILATDKELLRFDRPGQL